MKSNQKKLIFTILKLVSSVALLLWVIRRTHPSEIFQALSSANVYLLIAALIVYCGSYYFRTHRWRALLRARGLNASIVYLYQSYLVGIFFSNFLPSIVGGDAVRIYDVWRLEPNKSIAVATVLVDRILGLLTLIVFAVLAFVFAPIPTINLPLSYLWILLAAIAILVIIQKAFFPLHHLTNFLAKVKLSWWQKIQQKISNVFQAFLDLNKHKDSLAIAFLWSILVQIAVITHYYLIAKALNFPTPLTTFFLIVPIATVIMMLPISINGIGLRENAFVFLLGTYSSGVGRPETIAFTWVAYGIIVLQGLIGGIVYMLRR